jgi:hypothetical protein
MEELKEKVAAALEAGCIDEADAREIIRIHESALDNW